MSERLSCGVCSWPQFPCEAPFHSRCVVSEPVREAETLRRYIESHGKRGESYTADAETLSPTGHGGTWFSDDAKDALASLDRMDSLSEKYRAALQRITAGLKAPESERIARAALTDSKEAE